MVKHVSDDIVKELRNEMRRNPRLAAEMKGAKKYDEKELVRRRWADLRAEQCKEELEALETLTIEDYDKGTWLTLKRIAVEMGGDIEGAQHYCESCVKLGKSEFRINVIM